MNGLKATTEMAPSDFSTNKITDYQNNLANVFTTFSSGGRSTQSFYLSTIAILQCKNTL